MKNKRNRKSKKNRRSPVPAVCSALGTILFVIIIVLCVPVTLPKMFGCEVYAVVSGSMEPAIPVGSIVYVKDAEPQEIQAEDVIAFYGGPESQTIITHRVVENQVIMGSFITKGDANEEKDMNPIDYEQFLGKVSFSIPGLGMIAQLLTSPSGKIGAAAMIVLAAVLHVLADVIEKRE